MNLRKRCYIMVFSFIVAQLVYGQEQILINKDSLAQQNIDELYSGFDSNFHSDKKTAKIYAEFLLQKLKETKSVTKIASGYRIMSSLYLDDFEMQIAYLDSAISYGKKSKYKYYPTKFYLRKGALCADKGFFNKAMNSYLKGLEFAQKKNDQENEFAFTHNIALLKRKLGKYKEAKYLFKKCLKFEELKVEKSKKDSLSYLVTLADLITTYLRNKEIDSAYIYNAEGMKISKNIYIENLFKLNEGIIKYHQKKYTNSISEIEKVLSKNNKYYFSNYNVIDAYYALGKSYEATKKEEKAIFYFKRIDSLVLETNYLIPEIRPAYNALIKHYKSIENKNNQLHYINRLLYNDSILNHNYRELNDKMIKGFDTPILLSEKEKLIGELEIKNSRSNYSLIIALLVIFLITISLIFNYKRHKRYKFRFEELMKNTQEKTAPVNSPTIQATSIGIADNIVEKILNGLQDFEKNNGFTNSVITSAVLAKKLNTNTKYLTQVIKHHKQKKFSPYINDLRVNYIIDQLKKDQKLQQYTIKALAEEAGFNSAEVFSKYFFKKTGIYPSYFVKKIQSSDFQ
ncbi:helix-turn-helix domain-containing protein [Aquimarina sp. M1]